jgi:excinuclease UvrABC nuclease subunit
MSNEVFWSDHAFTAYRPEETQWSNHAGIYIFAGLNRENRWMALYIGQCDSFHDRIPSHEQWDKARSFGATHVHAMVVPQVAIRAKIEQELIQKYQPRLNSLLR